MPRMTAHDTQGGQRFLLGAAIGTGLLARACERGGADFVLALNAGVVRARGLPSVASMLPLGDANAQVVDVARREIATQVAIPVHAGLSVFPGADAVARDLRRLARSRVAGVVNFPTVVHFDGAPRAALESAGLGFDAEVAMLADAAALGLATLAYVKTEAEAERAARIAPTMICINFGWNAGGRLTELLPDVSINEAVLRARTIARRLARIAPGTRVLIEGGPVVHPRQVAEVCAAAGTQGYVGGSTLDRLPIEDAVYDRALAFKSAARARAETARLPARLRRSAADVGLVGPSAALEAVLTRIAALAQGHGHIVVSGAPGTQRHAAARLFAVLAGLEPRLSVLNIEEQPQFETGIRLFGRGAERAGLLEAADGGALQLEPLGALAPRWQRKLARFLDRGTLTRYLGRVALRPVPRLIMLSDAPLARLRAQRRIVPELADRLAAREVIMPGLDARRTDVPNLVEWLIAGQGARFALGPSAMGLLMRAALARHVADLRAVIEALEAAGATGTLGAVDLDGVMALPRPSEAPVDSAGSERAWILDALRRHGFNRTAAARALGIGRKTLYNRMRRHGL